MKHEQFLAEVRNYMRTRMSDSEQMAFLQLVKLPIGDMYSPVVVDCEDYTIIDDETALEPSNES